MLQTKNDVFLLTSSGTAAMESAVANLVNAGETAIVATSGAFGDRWGKLLEAYGAQVVYVKAEWGRAVNPADLAKALKLTPQAKAVFCQHTETSTGVVKDLPEFGRLVAGTPAILVVDAISGLAGQELQTDAWKLDVVVSGSQKGPHDRARPFRHRGGPQSLAAGRSLQKPALLLGLAEDEEIDSRQ